MKMDSKTATFDMSGIGEDDCCMNCNVNLEGDNISVDFSWCEDSLSYDELVEYSNVLARTAYVLGKEYTREIDEKKFEEMKDRERDLSVMLYHCRDAIRNGNIDEKMADEIDEVLK